MSVAALVVLGSTGSVGAATLEVASALQIRLYAIGARRNWQRLAAQARAHRPAVVVCVEAEPARRLRDALADLPEVEVRDGEDAFTAIAAAPEADAVLTAVVGVAGLLPTMAAVEAGKRVCIANKEPLVVAGRLIMQAAAASGAEIIPVDSEHSALFQCLGGRRTGDGVASLILTASGGPFRGRRDLTGISVAEALAHPTWQMGDKISIDSATMMNKALEVIEAHHLFAMPLSRIEVVVHPQSVVHSLVAFADGSVLAQLGDPDMRTPIQVSLTWPERRPGPVPPPRPASWRELHFEEVDTQTFPSLALGRAAAAADGLAPCAFNAANELAVERFLAGDLSFTGIFALVEQALQDLQNHPEPDLDALLTCDRTIRARYRSFRP